MPGIVKPSPAKQDMDALPGSMSKFGCLHDTQKKWWTSFLSGLNDEFERVLQCRHMGVTEYLSNKTVQILHFYLEYNVTQALQLIFLK